MLRVWQSNDACSGVDRLIGVWPELHHGFRHRQIGVLIWLKSEEVGYGNVKAFPAGKVYTYPSQGDAQSNQFLTQTVGVFHSPA